jgi:negative regulator of sigma E activity
LKDERDFLNVDVILSKILSQIFQTLNVLLFLNFKRISHEYDAIHTFENQFAGRIVHDLARDGIKLDLYAQSLNLTEGQREKVKKERAVTLGVDGNHLTTNRVGHGLV